MPDETTGIDVGRFGRTLTLIAFVTAVFVMLTANRVDPELTRIGFFAIGAVALVTAIVGFLIAAGSMYE